MPRKRRHRHRAALDVEDLDDIEVEDDAHAVADAHEEAYQENQEKKHGEKKKRQRKKKRNRHEEDDAEEQQPADSRKQALLSLAEGLKNSKGLHEKYMVYWNDEIDAKFSDMVDEVMNYYDAQEFTDLFDEHELQQKRVERVQAAWPQIVSDLVNAHEQTLLDEIEELKKENKQIKVQATERCYVRNEVLQYESIKKQDVKLKAEVEEKQKEIDTEFNTHADRLHEWNQFLPQIQAYFLSYDETQKRRTAKPVADEVDNDEKFEQDDPEDVDVDLNVRKLLDTYTNCMHLVYEQQSRTESMVPHVIALSKHKKLLKRTVKEYKSKQAPTQQKYEALCATYTNLKLRREHLQNQMVKLLDEVNKITDEENATNRQKCETLDIINVSVIEEEKYAALLTKCKSLTAKYNEYTQSVDAKMEELSTYFASKWDEHERRWTKWNVDDIICWLEYLVESNRISLSNQVNLSEIAAEMKQQKITGKALEEMEKGDLKLFGFGIFDDMSQIYKQIRELVSKYPRLDAEDAKCQNELEVEGGVQETAGANKVQVPQEYLCPITRKLMVDPVIYDGITYDRDNFIKHVQKHRTVPNTNEEYDEDEAMFDNKPLKQKIDAWLAVNSQYINEGV